MRVGILFNVAGVFIRRGRDTGCECIEERTCEEFYVGHVSGKTAEGSCLQVKERGLIRN